MAHPDLQKALELVTKHAGRAHAEKVFAHLLGTPTPAKALNEGVQTDVLEHDINTGLPQEGGMPMGDESEELLETGSEPGEESHEAMPHRLPIASTRERMPPPEMPMMPAEEMPRKKGWPKGKARKAK